LYCDTGQLVVLDVVVADQRHPDQGSGSQGEWEVLGQTKCHGLEDKKLTGKMAKGNDVGPISQSVDRTNVEVVGGVASNDTGDECPSTEQSARERSQLVGGLGIILSRDQFVRLILGFEVVGLGRELGVANETAVVDSPGKVQSGVRLQRITNRDDGKLQWSAFYSVEGCLASLTMIM
jgi:hypothetical protein